MELPRRVFRVGTQDHTAVIVTFTYLKTAKEGQRRVLIQLNVKLRSYLEGITTKGLPCSKSGTYGGYCHWHRKPNTGGTASLPESHRVLRSQVAAPSPSRGGLYDYDQDVVSYGGRGYDRVPQMEQRRLQEEASVYREAPVSQADTSRNEEERAENLELLREMQEAADRLIKAREELERAQKKKDVEAEKEKHRQLEKEQTERQKSRAKESTTNASAPAKETWTVEQAFKRYCQVGKEFDKMEFGAHDELDNTLFGRIPWPVLKDPTQVALANIMFPAVKEFFTRYKERSWVTGERYMKALEKCERRFHHDTWKTRKVLSFVEDKATRRGIRSARDEVSRAVKLLIKNEQGESDTSDGSSDD